jgi:hypothetical protein
MPSLMPPFTTAALAAADPLAALASARSLAQHALDQERASAEEHCERNEIQQKEEQQHGPVMQQR